MNEWILKCCLYIVRLSFWRLECFVWSRWFKNIDVIGVVIGFCESLRNRRMWLKEFMLLLFY